MSREPKEQESLRSERAAFVLPGELAEPLMGNVLALRDEKRNKELIFLREMMRKIASTF
ncbi:MAG: hypothetical protein ABSF52_02450 [Syntrophobacteraceae bacterium]|jgi:hypothetical protein